MKYALIKNGELDTNVIYSQYAPAAHDAQNYTIGTGFDCWVVLLYTKFERECTAKATKYSTTNRRYLVHWTLTWICNDLNLFCEMIDKFKE